MSEALRRTGQHWELRFERNLAHPALDPVRAWFDAYVPADKRAPAWSEAAAA